MKKMRITQCLFLALILSACSVAPDKFGETTLGQQKNWPRFLQWLKPYEPPIPQGVFVTKEMLQQLKAGMTRQQVVFILGSPLLVSPFHKNRLEYPFRYDNGEGVITNSALTVFFNDKDLVTSVAGGKLPEEIEFIRILNLTK